jgi:hypothetical protein
MESVNNVTKKCIFSTLACALLATAIAGLPARALAQSTNKSPAPAKTADKKAAPEKKEANSKNHPSIPFHGTLKEVDKSAKTITVDKRTFHVTSETKKIYRGEKPATLEDGVVGEYVTGSYWKTDDGKLVANSIYFGGKNKDKKAETGTEKKKEK